MQITVPEISLIVLIGASIEPRKSQIVNRTEGFAMRSLHPKEGAHPLWAISWITARCNHLGFQFRCAVSERLQGCISRGVYRCRNARLSSEPHDRARQSFEFQPPATLEVD